MENNKKYTHLKNYHLNTISSSQANPKEILFYLKKENVHKLIQNADDILDVLLSLSVESMRYKYIKYLKIRKVFQTIPLDIESKYNDLNRIFELFEIKKAVT